MEKLSPVLLRLLGLVLMVIAGFISETTLRMLHSSSFVLHLGSDTRVLPSTGRDDLDLVVSNNPSLPLERFRSGPGLRE